MMDPSFLLELDHNCIDEGIASLPISPGIEIGVIAIPLYLLANRISLDFIEVRSEGPIEIEELSPKKLSFQRYWR
jgi:hypothetical protein